MIKSIAVIGLGKLGAPMVAAFASKGYRVVGVDVDPEKVQALKSGVAPVDEPGLGPMLRGGQAGMGFKKPWIEATTDIEFAVRDTDVTFIVVATPSDEDGKFSLRYVLEVCEKIGKALAISSKRHIVVLTSTVTPGATDGPVLECLERVSGKSSAIDFGLCYNPEFIALGTVIRDFLNPDFVLIGESDVHSGAELAQLYREVCDNDPKIARMSPVNAEITKLALNTYVTTKISYGNMLAMICGKLPGANVDVVTAALGLDTRIGTKCLKGGVPYGGPCFPRDNRALSAVARDLGVPDDIPMATDTMNRAFIQRLADLAQSFGGPVGVLGLSYKTGTAITEEAAGTLLLHELHRRNVIAIGWDPSYPRGSAAELAASVKVIVIAMPHPQFSDLPSFTWADRVVIDCWRILAYHGGIPSTTRYVPLGIGLGL
jgi:UDPglucose 6-dehydrogenase